ncbi:sporulation delaying protein family toxin [Corallococcus exiguus]|uniref:sporulation delaying protein family toxin n=1 Tax=Corallococcus exiguus TaxID=83462 RepID=UPI001A8CB70C|nr:sporulation delaying protein family toxin [Corallococcus exiguus]
MAVMTFTFTTVGTGCGGPSDVDTQSASTRAQHQAASGEDLFLGMVFGVGPAAHHFDDLWKRPEIQSRLGDAEKVAKREEAANVLMAKIAARDATFFDRFGRDLRSGNHLTIDRLLTETKERTQAAAAELRKEAGLPGDVNASAAQAEKGTWFYEETVVAVAIAAVLLVVVTQIDVTPLVGDTQASALRRDTWVDQLANKSFDAL